MSPKIMPASSKKHAWIEMHTQEKEEKKADGN
jgi:hypothetical protein